MTSRRTPSCSTYKASCSAGCAMDAAEDEATVRFTFQSKSARCGPAKLLASASIAARSSGCRVARASDADFTCSESTPAAINRCESVASLSPSATARRTIASYAWTAASCPSLLAAWAPLLPWIRPQMRSAARLTCSTTVCYREGQRCSEYARAQIRVSGEPALHGSPPPRKVALAISPLPPWLSPPPQRSTHSSARQPPLPVRDKAALSEESGPGRKDSETRAHVSSISTT